VWHWGSSKYGRSSYSSSNDRRWLSPFKESSLYLDLRVSSPWNKAFSPRRTRGLHPSFCVNISRDHPRFFGETGVFCLSPNHRKPGFSIEPANKFVGCGSSLLGESGASYPVNWDTPHLLSEVSSRQKLCVTLTGRRTLLTTPCFPPLHGGKQESEVRAF